MTDSEWQKIIKRCRNHGDKHKDLLLIAETEYLKRYGHKPSEVDDDWWIDGLHYCSGDVGIEKIKESAELRMYSKENN